MIVNCGQPAKGPLLTLASSYRRLCKRLAAELCMIVHRICGRQADAVYVWRSSSRSVHPLRFVPGVDSNAARHLNASGERIAETDHIMPPVHSHA
jgi:hypothetical protein